MPCRLAQQAGGWGGIGLARALPEAAHVSDVQDMHIHTFFLSRPAHTRGGLSRSCRRTFVAEGPAEAAAPAGGRV